MGPRRTTNQLDLFQDRPAKGGTCGDAGANPIGATEDGANRTSDELKRYLDAVAENGRRNRKRIEKLALGPVTEGAPGGRRDKPPGAFAHAQRGR